MSLVIKGYSVNIHTLNKEPNVQKVLQQLATEPIVLLQKENIFDRVICQGDLPDVSRKSMDHHPFLNHRFFTSDRSQLVAKKINGSRRKHSKVNRKANRNKTYDQQQSPDHVESELEKIFLDAREDKVVNKKRKKISVVCQKQQTLEEKLARLFGVSPTKDIEPGAKKRKLEKEKDLEQKSPQKIDLARRRATLPVSIKIPQSDWVRPLRVSIKRNSDSDILPTYSCDLSTISPINPTEDFVPVLTTKVFVNPEVVEERTTENASYDGCNKIAIAVPHPVVYGPETIKIISIKSSSDVRPEIIDLTEENDDNSLFENMELFTSTLQVKRETRQQDQPVTQLHPELPLTLCTPSSTTSQGLSMPLLSSSGEDPEAASRSSLMSVILPAPVPPVEDFLNSAISQTIFPSVSSVNTVGTEPIVSQITCPTVNAITVTIPSIPSTKSSREKPTSVQQNHQSSVVTRSRKAFVKPNILKKAKVMTYAEFRKVLARKQVSVPENVSTVTQSKAVQDSSVVGECQEPVGQDPLPVAQSESASSQSASIFNEIISFNSRILSEDCQDTSGIAQRYPAISRSIRGSVQKPFGMREDASAMARTIRPIAPKCPNPPISVNVLSESQKTFQEELQHFIIDSQNQQAVPKILPPVSQHPPSIHANRPSVIQSQPSCSQNSVTMSQRPSAVAQSQPLFTPITARNTPIISHTQPFPSQNSSTISGNPLTLAQNTPLVPRNVPSFNKEYVAFAQKSTIPKNCPYSQTQTIIPNTPVPFTRNQNTAPSSLYSQNPASLPQYPVSQSHLSVARNQPSVLNLPSTPNGLASVHNLQHPRVPSLTSQIPAQQTEVSQPPQLKRVESSNKSASMRVCISHGQCAQKIHGHLSRYLKLRSRMEKFWKDELQDMMLTNSIVCSSVLKRYIQHRFWTCSQQLAKDLATVYVENFNFNTVLNQICEIMMGTQYGNGSKVSIFLHIYDMIATSGRYTTTPFLMQLYNNVIQTYRVMEDKIRTNLNKNQNLFTPEQLDTLKSQIVKYKILSRTIASGNSLPNINGQRNGASSQSSKVPSNPPSSRNVTVASNFSAMDYLHTLMQKHNDSNQRNTAGPVQEPQNTNSSPRNVQDSGEETVIDETNHSGLINETDCDNASNETGTVLQVPDTVSTTTNVENDPKEAELVDCIDLTWIEEGDLDEMYQEMQNSKNFPLKVECLVADDGIEAGDRDSVSPADSGVSGVASPRVENDFKCLCGKEATFVCVCNSSMYCGRDCQIADWQDHRKFCDKMKN